MTAVFQSNVDKQNTEKHWMALVGQHLFTMKFSNILSQSADISLESLNKIFSRIISFKTERMSEIFFGSVMTAQKKINPRKQPLTLNQNIYYLRRIPKLVTFKF